MKDTCKQCGGSGVVDSGGFTEQGKPIDVPCGCDSNLLEFGGLTKSMVGAVEDALSMGSGAWDMLDPRDVIHEILKLNAKGVFSGVIVNDEAVETGMDGK
jgi:hypothetical protein